jgi:hypothetical protein
MGLLCASLPADAKASAGIHGIPCKTSANTHIV